MVKMTKIAHFLVIFGQNSTNSLVYLEFGIITFLKVRLFEKSSILNDLRIFCEYMNIFKGEAT